MDSACAGSLTNKRSLLVNIRPCSERFVGSDGVVESAECIGDMPVLAVDGSGKIVKKTFTNVRCVPKFEFTLLSVVQLWEEQRIDSLFANLKHLQFPADEGGIKLPSWLPYAMHRALGRKRPLYPNQSPANARERPLSTWYRTPDHVSALRSKFLN